MATYTGTGLDGLPSIYRSHPREVWKLNDCGDPAQRNYCERELQGQLRSQREELRRRDELIRELTGGDFASRPLGVPPCASARGEVAALRAKVDSLMSKLRDRQLELEAANDTIGRLRSENERLREDNARESTLNAELSRQLGCGEATRGSFEALKSRSCMALSSLQEQYRAAQDRIYELEARVRANLEERERAQTDKTGVERRYGDFANRVIYHLGSGTVDDLDSVVAKVAELVQENVMMKSKIHSLSDHNAALELEAKSNTETIQRLLAEVNKEHREKFLQYTTQTDFKTENETLVTEKEDLEKQVELLEARLETNKKQLEATKADQQEKEAQVAKLECERLEAVYASQNSEKQLLTFVESLASLLSTAYSHVTPTEEAVKEKVKLLCREVKEHSASVTALEERVRSVTQQFELQFETNRGKESKARRTENEYLDMRERIRALESELAAGDVLRDGLKADKEKFYKYMRRLAEAMRMDYAAIDVGFDVLGDGLLVRAEQLVRQAGVGPGGEFMDGCLQQKLRSMKEQLDSKDMHLELLRKKVTQLETAAATAQPMHDGYAVKLQRHLEKSQDMLEDARQEIAALRGQLMQCTSIRATAIEQNRDLATLESTMEKLERVRQKQAKKIAMLKAEVESRDRQFGDRRSVTEGTLNSLGNEVKATRRALEEARRRERQLMEFRASVARMLGLAADPTGVSDADIFARLDRMIQSQQRGQYVAFSGQRPLDTMEASFQEGYDGPRRSRGRSPGRECAACIVTQPRGRRSDKRHRSGSRQRTRSVSPLRDNRRY